MITEAQKIKFKEYLDTFFYIVNKEINGETVEKNKQLEIWAVNVSSRYSYAVQGIKKNMHLPKEHIEILKESLEKQGLTLDEFLKTKGRRSNIVKLLKEKQKNSNTQNNNDNKEDIISKSLENYSIEDLKKLRAQYDEDIVSLSQKHTQKYKKLYSLSDTKYEEIGKRLGLAKKSRKRINEIIEKKSKEQEVSEIQQELVDNPTVKQDNTEIIEIPEVESKQKKRKQKPANEKITELMQETSEKEAKIEELKSQLEQLQKARQKEILDYQGDYERRLEEKKQQLEEKFNNELERKTSMIELEHSREVRIAKEELETAKKALEDYKKQQAKEIDRQRRILTNQAKELNEKQKEEIVNLLCTKDNITTDDIKQKLEQENIPTEGLKRNLKELKIEIPGIIKSINKDGETFTYSIKESAIAQLEEYRQKIISPKISNIQDGTVEFIVRSDLHLNMTNSEETIKKTLFPYIEYSAKKNNLPIIDLGDLADTLIKIKRENWETMDKNAIREAYKFYKNYAKVIASAPEIKHYTLLGNHDEHPFLAGIDPLEIIFEHCDNFISLGISNGSFKIGNDEIGVYHDKSWQNIVSYKKYKKTDRDELIYEYVCEEIEKIAKDYIYSLIGHYHFGKHNPELSFSVIGNGTESSLLFTAEVKDGHVERMFVTELYLINPTQYKRSNYQTEIYNRGNIYKKTY